MPQIDAGQIARDHIAELESKNAALELAIAEVINSSRRRAQTLRHNAEVERRNAQAFSRLSGRASGFETVADHLADILSNYVKGGE